MAGVNPYDWPDHHMMISLRIGGNWYKVFTDHLDQGEVFETLFDRFRGQLITMDSSEALTSEAYEAWKNYVDDCDKRYHQYYIFLED
jgi:hypothetical protein